MDWYPWYPALYRADTLHLTAEQDGIYRRLIDHYMETRMPLPDNDLALARIASVTPECFKNASSILRAFFVHGDDGKLHHKRCNSELDSQDSKSKKYTQRASHAANKRWKKQEDECYKHATRMLGDATRQDKTRQKKERTASYADLSVEDISDWLAEKRKQGKYINHDEYFVLEQFKLYCESKSPKYTNYRSALMKAFEWESMQPKTSRQKEVKKNVTQY